MLALVLHGIIVVSDLLKRASVAEKELDLPQI